MNTIIIRRTAVGLMASCALIAGLTGMNSPAEPVNLNNDLKWHVISGVDEDDYDWRKITTTFTNTSKLTVPSTKLEVQYYDLENTDVGSDVLDFPEVEPGETVTVTFDNVPEECGTFEVHVKE